MISVIPASRRVFSLLTVLGAAGHALCKRGIASNTAPGAAFFPAVTWWYDWALQSSGAGVGTKGLLVAAASVTRYGRHASGKLNSNWSAS